MTYFKDQIFMGNGDKSLAACYNAHRLLEEAIQHIEWNATASSSM